MNIHLNIAELMKISTATEAKLLFIVLRDSSCKEIIIIKPTKERWAKEIGVSISTINNTLLSLKNLGFINNVARSIYKIDKVIILRK